MLLRQLGDRVFFRRKQYVRFHYIVQRRITMFEFAFNDHSSFLINTNFLESKHKIKLTPGLEVFSLKNGLVLLVLMFELCTVFVGFVILVGVYYIPGLILVLDHF